MSKWLLPSLTGIMARAAAQDSEFADSGDGDFRLAAKFRERSCGGKGGSPAAGEGSGSNSDSGSNSHSGSHSDSGSHIHFSAKAPAQRKRPLAKTSLPPEQTEQQWRSAVATLQDLLADQIDPNQPQTTQAVILCGPLPLISRADLYRSMATWLFVSDGLASTCGLALQLRGKQTAAEIKPACLVSVPILEQDSLAQEQFCLVITADFGMVLALGKDDSGEQVFQFSCDPAVLKLCWQSLLLRVRLSNAHYAKQLDHLFDLFAPQTPDYRWMSRFTQRMMQHFALISSAATEQRLVNLVERVKTPLEAVQDAAASSATGLQGLDVELLRAIAHEVRTPLATIRTMARSLLRRKDLDARATQRLESIDQECTEQIDRFGLIFKAAELETASPQAAQHLAATSLDQIFRAACPAGRTRPSGAISPSNLNVRSRCPW
ncbi:MAG: hypothetical protein HC824_05860 [Synechococcales cyanobacterium RM1_1_8]|nr:hypothetical protein [Synechococcales cyanobacterium RM1_1_8]